MLQNVLCLVGSGLIVILAPKVLAAILREGVVCTFRVLCLFAVGVMMVVQKFIF